MAILTIDKRDVQVSDNLEKTGFRVQANAKAFEVLSDRLYKYKIRAVIREINCNAYDAHVDAGNPELWDVHLPTMLEPWFSVRDYGTGLSPTDVKEVFTVYFASTKTNSNDFIGALGLGSKSPFSLVESFSVTSWQDGIKTIYSCYKDEHGEPQCVPLSTSASDEPNGLEIKLSTDQYDEFADEAVEVFQYFNTIPNINDHSVIEEINERKSQYEFVTDDMSLSTSYGTPKAVMGNVAYNIPSEYDNLGCIGIIHFDIGDLSFAASREELSLDDHTIARIKERMAEAKTRAASLIVEEIEAKDNKFEQYSYKHNVYGGCLRNLLRDQDLSEFDPPTIKDDDEPLKSYYRSTWARDSVDYSELRRLPLGEDVHYFRFLPRFKTRIIQHLRENRGQRFVLLTDEQIKFFDIPEDRIEDLETVVPKLSRAITSGGSSYIRSKVAVWNTKTPGWRCPARDCWTDVDIDTDGVERVYVETSRYEPVLSTLSIDDFENILDSLEHVGIDKPEIYGLKTAFLKTKAFKNGNWITLQDFIKRETANLPDVTVVDYNSNWTSLFKKLNEKIECDLLKGFVTLAKKKTDDHSNRFAYRRLSLYNKIVKDDSIKELEKKIVSTYPVVELLNYHGDYITDTQMDILVNIINGEQK